MSYKMKFSCHVKGYTNGHESGYCSGSECEFKTIDEVCNFVVGFTCEEKDQFLQELRVTAPAAFPVFLSDDVAKNWLASCIWSVKDSFISGHGSNYCANSDEAAKRGIETHENKLDVTNIILEDID